MEGLRKTLDNLMGKDRNLPLREQILKKKHFDDPDVCKFFLIGFCPHELFTYVKSSNIGECHYRHDQQFKINFELDPNKEKYQIKYEEDLISFLESITSELDIKIKRCLERIEMPPPEQVLNKDTQIELENLDKEITEKISEAEHLGEMGLIEQSEKLMKEIEQIKIQRNLLTNTKEHVAIYKDRQMKVCEICGALQSAIDNEKRIQTHKEGKIHSAYLKIRQYLDLLRKKRMERQIKESEIKQKDKLMKELKVKEKEKEKNFDKEYKEYKEYKDYKRKYDDYNYYDKYERDKRKKYSRSRSKDRSYKSHSRSDKEKERKKYDEKYYNNNGGSYYKEYKEYKEYNGDYNNRDRDREERNYYKNSDYKDRSRDNKDNYYKNINERKYNETKRYSKDRSDIKERKERRDYEREYDRDKERDRDTYRNSRIRREDSYSKYENKKRY